MLAYRSDMKRGIDAQRGIYIQHHARLLQFREALGLYLDRVMADWQVRKRVRAILVCLGSGLNASLNIQSHNRSSRNDAARRVCHRSHHAARDTCKSTNPCKKEDAAHQYKNSLHCVAP